MSNSGLNIEIIEPSMSDMVFLEGEKRTIQYQIKNNCENIVKDISFDVNIVIRNEDNTERNKILE